MVRKNDTGLLRRSRMSTRVNTQLSQELEKDLDIYWWWTVDDSPILF